MPNIADCIAFTNHKGGTGKTTSCVNIAGFLAKSGLRTLVVGGRIRVESEFGKGSRFTFVIPTRPNPEAGVQASG